MRAARPTPRPRPSSGASVPPGERVGAEERRPVGAAEPSAHRLYAHVAWATLGSLPLADARTALALESELISLCRRLDVEPVEVSVEADRAHLLVRYKPTQALGTLVRQLKDGSAEAALRRASALRWGRGWAAVTVTPADVRDRKRRLAGRNALHQGFRSDSSAC